MIIEQREIDRIQQRWIEAFVEAHLGSCLHVGCGSKPIAGAVNIDPNPDCAQWADVQLDVHDLSVFPDASFAVIVSNHVIPSLADPVAALREMARVLKPGGIMAHVIPDLRYAPRRTDQHHPFAYQPRGWHGPAEFRPLMLELSDVLRIQELENFTEFEWSFKVVAVRL